MIYPIARAWSRLVLPAVVCSATLLSSSPAVRAQAVEKQTDLRNIVTGGVYQSGSSAPYDNSIQIGNQLWFTTTGGGTNGAGTISYYDLTTHAITAYVSMDNTSGITPQSSLTQIGNKLYFTTTSAGTGNTGTISSVTLGQTNPTVATLYNFGPSTTANPRNPGGSLTIVGDDLYFTTPNGGTGGSAYGTIGKYNLTTGTVSTVYNFTGTGAANGRQPMEGFTNVGGKLYFTTFTGGANAGTGYPNGTGTLGVLDPAAGSVNTLASMPVGSGQFPAHNAVQASNGLLYFTTVGNATTPGSLQSFNIATGTLATVYTLASAGTGGIFADGKFAYGSVVELNNVLYFATMQGGTYNRGTIDAFDLSTNTLIKLADLDGGTTENQKYLGQGTRGGMTLVNENGTNYLYLLTNAGGVYGNGTVLRITPLPVPEPGTVALVALTGVGGLWWRRQGKRTADTSPVKLAGGNRRAFTLIELLVTMGIVAVLTAITLPMYFSINERAREAQCLSNLRQIGVAYYSYAQDHGNYFPSAETIGYSNYRQANDPLGLPMLFAPYLGTERGSDGNEQGSKVWMCPSGRPLLKSYGNNYAWSRSADLTTKSVAALSMDGLRNMILAWDNYPWTLPSIYNVPEASSTGGPRAPAAQYQYFPHRSRTKLKTDVNWLYADGHAATQFNDGK